MKSTWFKKLGGCENEKRKIKKKLKEYWTFFSVGVWYLLCFPSHPMGGVVRSLLVSPPSEWWMLLRWNPQEVKPGYHRCLHFHVQFSIIYKSKDKVSSNRWIEKENVVSIKAIGYYRTLKGKILKFVTRWLEPGEVMLNEVSQASKDEYCITWIICKI